MIAFLGDLEAGVDFVEEAIEFISSSEMVRRLHEGRYTLAGLLSDSEERLPSGYRPVVVLAGLPNAGKSTLFNRLAEVELAIASTIAGTTRDYLSCQVTIGDLTVDLIDTAGWDHSRDDIMSTVKHLRQEQLNSADLVIWCTAADLNDIQLAANDQLLAEKGLQATPYLSLTTCIDRLPAESNQPGTLGVSAVSGAGLDELRRCIVSTLTKKNSDHIELLATTSARCRDSIQQAIVGIDSAVDSATRNLGDEITAIGLREALRELRSVLGETWTDDILDHIFSSFCIGK